MIALTETQQDAWERGEAAARQARAVGIREIVVMLEYLDGPAAVQAAAALDRLTTIERAEMIRLVA